jgi:hypothetical protein
MKSQNETPKSDFRIRQNTSLISTIFKNKKWKGDLFKGSAEHSKMIGTSIDSRVIEHNPAIKISNKVGFFTKKKGISSELKNLQKDTNKRISNLVSGLRYKKNENTLRVKRPIVVERQYEVSNVNPDTQSKSLNISYNKKSRTEYSTSTRQKDPLENVRSKESSIIRSKFDFFGIEQKFPICLPSNKITNQDQNKSLDICMPLISKPTVTFVNDESRFGPKEYFLPEPKQQVKYRRSIVVSEDNTSNLMIHIKGRPIETILPRDRMKDNFGLQLQHLLQKDQNNTIQKADNIYIESFIEKETPLFIDTNTKDIELKIKQNFETNLRAMKEFGERICKRSKEKVSRIIEPDRQAKQKYRVELLLKMKDFLLFFKTLNLPPGAILKFPIRPFHHPKAGEFMEAAKFGDTERIKELLYRSSDLLVFEFDYLHLTPLHWAAKRNHANCAEELILKKSYVNARDVYGRTPLYYAIQSQCVELVYLLLVVGASPWSPRDSNYIDMAKGDERIIYYIKRFRFLDLILTFQKRKDRPMVRQLFIEKKIRVPRLANIEADLLNR